MAQTRDQWFGKLKSWLPAWFTSTPFIQEPILYALAKILSDQESDRDGLAAETYIDTADSGYLDLLGSERSVTRGTDEPDDLYRERVRKLRNTSDPTSLKDLVDAALEIGECAILAPYRDAPFLSRGAFLGCDAVPSDIKKNFFTVMIDKQEAPATTFASRDAFSSRSSFAGTTVSLDAVYQLIQRILDENKAFGVMYRIVERRN